jgi:hypothetical protein
MNKQKISEMVVDFAWDFIGQGSTLEERRNRLRSACTAWNYACVPERVGMEMLDKYMVEYQKWNPDVDAEECRMCRTTMEQLIQQKLRKYPFVIKQIISCELMVKDGQEHVYVVAVGATP